MANRDYYEVLGVTRGATDHDIRKAFRELAKIYHPDRNPGDAEAERRFIELNEAYDALRDANRRAIYDHHLAAEAENGGPETEPSGSIWQGFLAMLIMVVVLGGAGVLYYVFAVERSSGMEKSVQDKKKDQGQLGPKSKSSGAAVKSGAAKSANQDMAPNRDMALRDMALNTPVAGPPLPEGPKEEGVKPDAVKTDGAKSDGAKPEGPDQAEASAPTPAALWEKLRESDDLLALQDFIEKHPDSHEASAAQSRLQRLTPNSNDIMALEALVQLAQSRLSSELDITDLARKRAAELKEAHVARDQDESDWKIAEGKGKSEGKSETESILSYLRERPTGSHAQAARARLASLGLVEVHMGSKGGEGAPGDETGDSKEQDRSGWFTGGEAQSFRDCSKCPEMVIAPAGEFKMGSPDNEEGRGQSEGPRHDVRIRKPFAIAKFEVTFDDWDACVAGGGCRNYKPVGGDSERGQRPVSNISWEDAQAYVQWLRRRTGKAYRLPTEAEWEYAARAGTETPYWWGSHVTPGQVNYAGERGDRGERGGGPAARPAKADAYEPNRWGLHQVAGNVWEWVEDCWHENYRGAPSDDGAWGEEGGGDCSQRALRGGSWMSGAGGVRSAHRGRVSYSMRDLIYGLRVARDL
jgi:formylglycine-generating enzyme required for sulfatase activity